MASQARLTIIADGPVGDLPARLIEITGYATVEPITILWESGITDLPGTAEGTKVECMGDAFEISEATDRVMEWLQDQSDLSTVILEISPSLSSRLHRRPD